MMKKTLFTLLLFLTAITTNAYHWHRYKIHMRISGKEAIVEGHVFEKTSFLTNYYCLVLKDGSTGKNDAVMKDLRWVWCQKENWSDPMPNKDFDYWCHKSYSFGLNFVISKEVEIEDLGRIR